MTTYSQKLNSDGTVNPSEVVTDSGQIVQNVAGSTPWDDYQAWLKAGNTLAQASLADAQAARIAFLSAACRAEITGGYPSSALGSPHTYPSTPTDQGNMQASVLASLLPSLPANWATPFWCADSTGKWAMVNHTAAQIQQVGLDGKTFVVAAQQKLATLTAQVEAATTVAEVQKVVWS